MSTVTATTSASTSATGKTSADAQRALNGNYQDFLKLLTTQLKNQDPSQPVDTNQLTAQIAALSQVEQEINTNTKLDNLISIYNANQMNTSVGYIGKQIDATGNQIDLESTEDSTGNTVSAAPVVYNLDGAAKTVTISIMDNTGKTIYTASAPTTAGRNQLIWDGTTSAGTKANAGIYTFKVSATDEKGNAVNATTYTSGIVTSIDTKNGVNSASLGKISVPLNTIQSIYTAGTNPSA